MELTHLGVKSGQLFDRRLFVVIEAEMIGIDAIAEAVIIRLLRYGLNCQTLVVPSNSEYRIKLSPCIVGTLLVVQRFVDVFNIGLIKPM